MNIGSCSLLIVHNAFQKVLTCLTIDLDQIPCDNFFFKLSFSCKNVTNSNFHKEVIMVFIGTTAKYCFAKNLIPDKKQVGFKKECFFFVTVSQYLIVNMHFEVKPLKDVQFIHPLKRNDPHATNAISHLALYFIEVFGIKFFLVFNNNSNVIKKELCDIICSHWQSH